MTTRRLLRIAVRWTANLVGLLVVAAFYNPAWDSRRVWAVAYVALWFTAVELTMLCAEISAREHDAADEDDGMPRNGSAHLGLALAMLAVFVAVNGTTRERAAQVEARAQTNTYAFPDPFYVNLERLRQ